MFNIPNKIRSGGIVYEVVIAEEWLGGNAGDYGMTTEEGDKNIIYINSKLTQELQEKTFIHELLHTFTTTLNHDALDLLTTSIYQVLSDNDFKNGLIF